ncbi:SDR family NAD(P)-dependent oxidoreductase [Actinotalea sp. K2]|uniref:SDR family NAD(P)-dependent oxidoreductase n=1 Tax=Actinotalea sp. K2 TaxID=2939438 RepID=UPI002017DE24|nr:SDR family NAD(P)-dependent oxidoreductase [Actinotalea sp. K2]MCL3862448.1 SDR family NAD(P)-dependent oxidoreductase [Actinotalea sp. K2]
MTGASSGIGRAVAHRLAARGARVVLLARSAETLEKVARECDDRGGHGLAVPTDVTDQVALRAAVAQVLDTFGRIDVWVGAAAVWSYGRFEDTPDAVFRQVVETTLLAQVAAARTVLPTFRAQGTGVLVHVASVYGVLSSPYVTPYVTAKWGLVGFTHALRHELRDAPGIAVVGVLPGAVDTPVYAHAANRVGREIRPLPPVTSPERVARAVVRAVDRGRSATVVVGRTQYLGVWVQRLAPRLYDRLVGPVVSSLTLRRGRVPVHDGTVFAPDPPSNAVRDGWRAHDRRSAGVAAAVLGVTGAAVTALAGRRTSRRGRA